MYIKPHIYLDCIPRTLMLCQTGNSSALADAAAGDSAAAGGFAAAGAAAAAGCVRALDLSDGVHTEVSVTFALAKDACSFAAHRLLSCRS